MPILSQSLRNRCARHLGYNRPRGVSPSLLQIFNQNCNNIWSNDDVSSTTGQSVVSLLNRCDKLFRATDPTDTIAFSQFQVILGDVNRQTRTLTIDDVTTKAREMYYIACDDLAYFLNVPNLQRPDVARRFTASLGDTFVQVTPNVPDTCISDRVYLSENFV
jgi:hypothetical protein